MIKFKQGSSLKNKKIHLPEILLEGRRVYLCPPTISDWQEWAEVRHNNAAYLKNFEPEWSKNYQTQEHFSKRLITQKIEWDAGRGAYFLIHHAQTKKIIGAVNLNNIIMGAACYANLGYWLDEHCQGQGFMRESLALIVDYAFNELRLNRLNAACLPDNQRSIRLLESLNFQEEGYAKAYLQINGTWQDHQLYGLVNQT